MEKGTGSRRSLKPSKGNLAGKNAGELIALQWMEHRNIFNQAIKGLRGKDSFTDATLACEGRFYPVHKFVLSTCSEYFSDIFEWTPCVNPVIVINNIIYDELEALLDFMYNGEVSVEENLISGILHAANCLRIQGLAYIDEEGQKTQLTAKNTAPASHSSSSSLNGPPKKKQRQDVKRKTSSSTSARSSTPSFRAPQTPRPHTRPSTPRPTTSRPATPRPTTPARPSTSSRPTPTRPTLARTSTPARPATLAHPHPSSPVSPVSLPPVNPPTVPLPPPTQSTLSPPPFISRVPSHTTTTVVATSSKPLYTPDNIVTPVLNLSIPSTICQSALSRAHATQLRTVSVGMQNQMTYPQIISAPAQNSLLQPQVLSTSQPMNQFVPTMTVSPQAQNQIILPQTSSDQGHSVLIHGQDDHALTLHHHQPSPSHSAHHPQMSHQLSSSQCDLMPAKNQQIIVESHQQAKQILVSIQSQLEGQEPSQCSPVPDFQLSQSGTISQVPMSETFVEQNHHSTSENNTIKEELMDPTENTVVVNVSLPGGRSSPPEISIPHNLTPIDTLIEAVKMENQDIVIKTDDGTVGIPEFLDSLEMRPLYEPKETQDESAETSQNSETSESLYEFTEVYPQTSASSEEPSSQFDQDQSIAHPQSSTNGRSSEDYFVCNQCNKTFKTKEGLRRHKKSHMKEPFACTLCSYTTTFFREFTVHKTTHAETLSCSMCDFTTKHAKEYTTHKKTHAEPIVCPLCDFSTKNLKEFCLHKKTHPEPYKCPICSYSSARFDLIKRHIARHKEGGALYQHRCRYCDYRCPNKPTLMKHIKQIHDKKLLKDG